MNGQASSPEHPRVSQKTKKSKDSKKKKPIKSAAFVQDDDGKNEGMDPDWAVKPPADSVLVDSKGEFGDFDWDRVNDDENLELWLVRVPSGLKPKILQDLKLDMPSSSKTTQVGHLEVKKNTTRSFDVWSLGEDQIEQVGGEELKGFTCLLPRKRKNGKLYQAPRPVARHLVISAKPSLPTPDLDSPPTYQNPPRPSVDPKLLTHRFMPLGSLAAGTEAQDSMDVDEPSASAPSELHAVPDVPRADEKPEGTKKKRKVDGDAPKKSKKSKTPTA